MARIELHTGDVFAAALFYGGVLGWAGESADSCQVEYSRGQIVVREGACAGSRPVATLGGAAVPGFEGQHRWHTSFRVTDVDAAAGSALAEGGRVITPPRGTGGRREAVLADREGVPFTVVAE
ncbi:VOC family protein [Streptomyces sp. NPDC046853]|uniref:VOC family protein n=1 Tax=Streptomyces sp. NPDC046853 TaxID=3154920 RepID=UPI003410563C